MRIRHHDLKEQNLAIRTLTKTQGMSRRTMFFGGLVSGFLASCGGGGSGAPGNSTSPDPVDTVPDQIVFVDSVGATIGVPVQSEPVTIRGISQDAPVSIEGGDYGIDGGEYRSTTGSISNGSRVRVRVQSSDEFEASVAATLTVGGVSGTFRVTTGPEDRMPDVFAFDTKLDVELSTSVDWDPVTISGINGDIPVTVVNGEFSIDGGPYSSVPSTIRNDQRIAIRHQSASDSDTFTGSSIQVGELEPEFNSWSGRYYVAAGDYEELADCSPYVGDGAAPIKIAFLNIGNAGQFDAIADDAINNQFAVIPPFNQHFTSLAFYKLDLGDGAAYECRGMGTDTNERGFECNTQLINDEVSRACGSEDPNGVIKIAIAESQYLARAGSVIWLPDNQFSFGNTVIHEVGHNFGLADLYGGGYRFDGDPVIGWPPELSRQWLNLDGPGCPGWCDSAKPPVDYNQSVSSACPTLTTRDECLAFNRPTPTDCADSDNDGHNDCCAWSDTPSEDYFETSCIPVWGAEDTGLSCLAGAGCYFGGAYGTNSWRPVRDGDDSLMYSKDALGFDTVSTRALEEVFECCASASDGEARCTAFRRTFADFFVDAYEKRRLGSCGVY